MVEMPGIEPGSNVYALCPYDHVPFITHIPLRKEQRRGVRFDAGIKIIGASGDDPTPLITPHPVSGGPGGDVFPKEET